ncbi:hypothetical protein, partial [Segatella oris]|uniref:hypothetical protein n=1 Tax=Segatella oris TaxID=28135 RepID=UPI0028E6A52E
TFFSVFRISSTDNERFSAIFAFCRPTTDIFQRFSHFVDRQRAFFSVFRVSSADNEHFSAFFAFRRLTTSIFQRFLHFVDRRRVFSCDFWFSKEG